MPIALRFDVSAAGQQDRVESTQPCREFGTRVGSAAVEYRGFAPARPHRLTDRLSGQRGRVAQDRNGRRAAADHRDQWALHAEGPPSG